MPNESDSVLNNDTSVSIPPSCIGIVGGLAIGSSCLYYQALYEMFTRDRERLELSLVHADLREVFKHFETRDSAGLASYLRPLIARLRRAGSTFAVIPAVAAHFAIPELHDADGLPIISLLDALGDAIKLQQPRKVVVFGTQLVMQTRVFGCLDALTEVLTLPIEELHAIDAIYRKLVHQGSFARRDLQMLHTIAETALQRERADAVVLAGTDFEIIGKGKIEFPHVSAFEAHLRAIRQAVKSTLRRTA